jgi:hypothetical protein
VSAATDTSIRRVVRVAVGQHPLRRMLASALTATVTATLSATRTTLAAAWQL